MVTIVDETITEPARGVPSPGARRMRRHRDRRKRSCRCITIELRESEVDELIRLRLLAAGERSDNLAVRKAVHGLFDRVFPARRRATACRWRPHNASRSGECKIEGWERCTWSLRARKSPHDIVI